MTTTLRYGSRGSEVQLLQKLLNKHLVPSPNLRIDGDFGERTHKAVNRFQNQCNLGVDGVVGPKTWKALKSGGLKVPIPPPAISSIDLAQAPWMTFANAEQGVEEKAGNIHNPRIIEYHSTTTLQATADETPWCSSFVNWCMKQAGITGTNLATAKSWIDWGNSSATQYGAVIVIYYQNAANSSLSSTGYHVGFWVGDNGTAYRIFGGNQDNMVKKSYYPKNSWQLKAIRWPS